MVKKPSVFELLRFNCSYSLIYQSLIHSSNFVVNFVVDFQCKMHKTNFNNRVTTISVVSPKVTCNIPDLSKSVFVTQLKCST